MQTFKRYFLKFLAFFLVFYLLKFLFPTAFGFINVNAKSVDVSGSYGIYQARYRNRNDAISVVSSAHYVSSIQVAGDGTSYTFFSPRESLITPTITEYTYYVMPEFRVFASANFKSGTFYTLNCRYSLGGELQRSFQNGLLSSSVGGLMSGASDYDTSVVSNVSVSYNDQYFTVTFKALQNFNSVRFRFGNAELLSNNLYTTLLLSNNSDYTQGFRIYILNLVEADDLNSALLGQITNQNSTIINQNKEIIDNSKKTTEEQKKTNDLIESTDTTGANSSGNDFFDNFNSGSNGDLTSLVSLPLNYINHLNDKCEPFTLPLGKFGNVSIPCLSSIWSSSGFSNIISIISAIINGLICYKVGLNLLFLFNNLRDPDNDKLEVMDL